MHDVLCTEEDPGSSAAHRPVAFSEVALEFADSLRESTPTNTSPPVFKAFNNMLPVAKSLISDLRHAKQLLCLQYLTGQRWGEQLMIRR